MLGAKRRLPSALRKGFIGFLKRALKGQGTLWWVELGEVFQVEGTVWEQAGSNSVCLRNGQSPGWACICSIYVGGGSGLNQRGRRGPITCDDHRC